MKVEVNTPEEYMGDVLGQINSKRGRIEEMGQRGQAKIITAPLIPVKVNFSLSKKYEAAAVKIG